MSVDTPTNHEVALDAATRMRLQFEIEQFLYREADLLDRNRFEEWLQMLAPDLHYWSPTRANRVYRERHLETSPPGESAYFDDTYEEMAQRVERLQTRMAWAEDPPSRTRHLVTNVRVTRTETADEFRVESCFYVYRTRMERDTDLYVGRRDDVLRRVGEGSYQVVRRTIVFDVAILLAKNLSVFF